MKRRDEFLVGLLTVAGLALAVVGAIWLSRGGLQQGYPLYAEFPWGAGLKRGQSVLLVGVGAGYVDKVELFQDGRLVTTLRINEDYRVPVGTMATVVAAGIFGDRAVALTPSAPNPISHQPGDTIPVGPTEPGIAELTRTADSVGRSVHAITSAMEAELVAGGGIAEIRRTIASTNRLVAQLSSVVELQSRQLSLTMANLRRATAAIDSAAIDSTVRNFRTASESAIALTEDLRTTNAQLATLVAKLGSNEGTAGRLINDPALYQDLRSLVTRIDSLSTDFQRNPRRYINLSIF
ncbi:MAG TPA: MlaD family protein [Gemmatimonadaceae bacterium]|nr:MlaD family protein [Gemmatimonadaceae bacterium]